ncbi:hypothetical protein V1511DRAFT_509027 [Dipodascopsis uninucleata]
MSALNLDLHTDPPAFDDAVDSMNAILGALDNWSVAKSLDDYQAKVYTGTFEGEPWFVRKSVFDGETYPMEWFRKALYENHFENLVEYYDVAQSCSLHESRGEWQGYKLDYALPPPFTKREITQWLTIKDTSGDEGEQFYIFSVPADYELSPEATRGVYSFFQVVRKLEDGSIEWISASTSDMRGNIPRWLQSMKLPALLINDIDIFLRWMTSQYADNTVEESA